MELVETGNQSYIRVVVVKSNKDIKTVTRKCSENKVSMNRKKNWVVTFKGEQIGRVWCRVPPTFRHKYVPAIMVREGMTTALNLTNKDDFIPPLTIDENGEMIKRMMAQAIARQKMLKTAQFVAIIGMLALLAVLAVLNLFWVPTSTAPIQAFNATQTTTIPILPWVPPL
jgi:hypothetical protein